MPPFVCVAVNVTLAPAQIVLPGFAATLTDGVTVDATVIITIDAAVAGLAQAIEEVIITVTVSPLAHTLFEYVLPVSAIFPFNRH